MSITSLCHQLLEFAKTGGTFDHATSPACNIPADLFSFSILTELGKKVMDTPTHAPADRGQTDSGEWSLILQGRTGCTQNTQTDIIVTVVCVVPVAGGRARKHRIVVPRTAPRHTTRYAFFPLLNIGWIGGKRKRNPPCPPFAKGGQEDGTLQLPPLQKGGIEGDFRPRFAR